MSDALTASVIVALRALRDGEPCEPTIVPAWTVIPPHDLVPSSTWRPSPAGAAVLDLVETIDRESADAIKRVAESIVADKWTATAAFQQRALKAEKELEALRARLAKVEKERDDAIKSRDSLARELAHASEHKLQLRRALREIEQGTMAALGHDRVEAWGEYYAAIRRLRDQRDAAARERDEARAEVAKLRAEVARLKRALVEPTEETGDPDSERGEGVAP